MRRLRKNGLTDKQEAFAQRVAKGDTLADAYRSAYSDKGGASVRVNACNLSKVDRVKKRIEELQAMIDADAVGNVKQIAADLYAMATDEDKPDGVRLKAYDQLTKILGGYGDNNMSISATVSLDGVEGMIADLLGGKAEK